MIRALLVALGVTLSISAASAADFEVAAKPNVTFIDVFGEIVDGDFARLSTALNKAAEYHKPIILMLASPGGDWAEANNMASLLRAWRIKGWSINTAVNRDCASSCVTLFAMGQRKIVSEKAGIWVHTVALQEVDAATGKVIGDRQETVRTAADSVKWARFLKSAGAPDSVAGKLVINGAQGEKLTRDELIAWGVEFLVPTP